MSEFKPESLSAVAAFFGSTADTPNTGDAATTTSDFIDPTKLPLKRRRLGLGATASTSTDNSPDAIKNEETKKNLARASRVRKRYGHNYENDNDDGDDDDDQSDDDDEDEGRSSIIRSQPASTENADEADGMISGKKQQKKNRRKRKKLGKNEREKKRLAKDPTEATTNENDNNEKTTENTPLTTTTNNNNNPSEGDNSYPSDPKPKRKRPKKRSRQKNIRKDTREDKPSHLIFQPGVRYEGRPLTKETRAILKIEKRASRYNHRYDEVEEGGYDNGDDAMGYNLAVDDYVVDGDAKGGEGARIEEEALDGDLLVKKKMKTAKSKTTTKKKAKGRYKNLMA